MRPYDRLGSRVRLEYRLELAVEMFLGWIRASLRPFVAWLVVGDFWEVFMVVRTRLREDGFRDGGVRRPAELG
jgi:hypothetical protein